MAAARWQVETRLPGTEEPTLALAEERGAQKAYLEYLYSGLHTPQSFLPGLDKLLAN